MSRTIAAAATGQSPGAIGIVRISGEEARAVAGRVFRPKGSRSVADAPGYTALYGRLFDRDGDFDEAIALVFAAPKSYTGEDVVELSCHGGMYAVQRLLKAVFAAGAQPADAGEFTKRAFLNGKIQLTEAEAVMDLISAQGQQANRAALSAKNGALWKRMARVKDELCTLGAHFAAWVDYPDDDIPELSDREVEEVLRRAKDELASLLSSFDAGRVLREGVETVIAGRPNVGKSTLMNALSGCERSIVTPVAGTTRDIVEETVRLGELTLHLSDTAGLRSSGDEVEAIGVERARQKLRQADLVLAVFDSSQQLQEEDFQLLGELQGRHAIAVVNKSDLPPKIDIQYIHEFIKQIVTISAKQEDGLAELSLVIAEVLGTARLDPSAGMLATERQRQCAGRAYNAVEEALGCIQSGITRDAISVLLDDAINAVLELTGEKAGEAVLQEVFSRFCVGK